MLTPPLRARVGTLYRIFHVALGIALLLVMPVWALTPAAQRGQQIYHQGTSPSGAAMTAILGQEGVAVPAATLPCAHCHGHDGRGKPEGGITPSNLTWEALTKPYSITHPSGRVHPPYTERRLKRAITMGLDAAGQQLHVVMPRYRLSHADLADLIAYLKELGTNLDPGLTATTIRLGTILPAAEQRPEIGQAIKAVLMAYFDRINQQGGIYGRRIELQFVHAPTATETPAQTIRSFIDTAQLFALTASVMAEADAEIASLLKEQRVPLVGALTLYPQLGFPLNPQIFYLYAGLNSQARALAIFAAKEYAESNPPAAIVYPDTSVGQEMATAVVTQCQQASWDAVQPVSLPAGQFDAAALVQRLRDRATEVLFLLSSKTATLALLQAAHQQNWHPMVLLSGVLVGQALFHLPASFQGRLLVALPTLPPDQASHSMQDYRQLAAAQHLPSHHRAMQLTALASAKILVEGLQRAGRNLSRQKLIEVLEGFYDFQTGLTPAITFGPNRRVGAWGAYIVDVDLKTQRFKPVSPWIELN